MIEKSRVGKHAGTSEGRRHFGEKLNQSSLAGSNRKAKLRGKRTLEVRNDILQGQDVREENRNGEGNVAEEVVESGNRTGDYLYESTRKAVQKRNIKKKMVTEQQKAARDSYKGATDIFGKIRTGIENMVQKAGEDVIKVVAENPMPVVCAGVLSLLLLTVAVGMSFSTMTLGSFQGVTLTTTYTAQDSEIVATDIYYGDLESQVKDGVEQLEESYPGYDEYVYTLDDIGHDPFELASLLTVLHEDYTKSDVTATLADIYEKQYEWTLEEVEETRILEETKTRLELKTRLEEKEGMTIYWDTELGKYVTNTYTYEEEVEYWEEVEYQEETEGPYLILQVTLTNYSIDGVAKALGLSEDQLERYEILTTTQGNKSYLFESPN